MFVNNNPQPSTSKPASFGMSLRIKSEAREHLEKCTMSILEKIKKAGEELKDTKFWDMEILKDGKIRLDTDDARSYTAPFNPREPHDEFLTVDTVWLGSDLSKLTKGSQCQAVIKFANKKQALDAYKKLKGCETNIEQGSELAKMLDAYEIEKAEKAAKEAEMRMGIKKAVVDLLEKFGDDTRRNKYKDKL